jgi:hypothetical protein
MFSWIEHQYPRVWFGIITGAGVSTYSTGVLILHSPCTFYRHDFFLVVTILFPGPLRTSFLDNITTSGRGLGSMQGSLFCCSFFYLSRHFNGICQYFFGSRGIDYQGIHCSTTLIEIPASLKILRPSKELNEWKSKS